MYMTLCGYCNTPQISIKHKYIVLTLLEDACPYLQVI